MRSEDEVVADYRPGRNPHHRAAPLRDPNDIATVDEAVTVEGADSVGASVRPAHLSAASGPLASLALVCLGVNAADAPA
jgi:hypothetical protein